MCSLQIFYINHSVNFFLYCITGKRFRMALSRACCCWYGRYGCCRSPASADAWSTTVAARRALVGAMACNGSGSGPWYGDSQARQLVSGPRSCPATPTG
jgi:hypothetical protein